MSIPRAFISYSHDSPEHKAWVLFLATRLRESGVDAILDLWELRPGADIPSFMERNLVQADRVLMVCTEKYVAKANAGTGGVGYEKMIVTADLMRNVDSHKVIPVIRQNGSHQTPTFLTTKMYLDFSREDQFEFSFDELLRTLHNSPLFVKPPVGSNPLGNTVPPPQRTGDPILILMKAAVAEFEDDPSTQYLSYSALVEQAQKQRMSRLYFDRVLEEAIKTGLIRRADQYLVITEAGKLFALENKLA